MGIVSSLLSQSNNNMKFLLVVAVAAYAKAEADPGFAYSIGHVPLTYAHAPVTYGAPQCTLPLLQGARIARGNLFPALRDLTSDMCLLPLLLLKQIPRPTHGCTIAVCTDIMAMDWDITTPLSPTPTLLTLTPMFTVIMVLATMVTLEERRGRQRPSPRPLLTPKLTHGCCTEGGATVDTITLPTHTLPTTTLSLISMEDAGTTKELWYPVLGDK